MFKDFFSEQFNQKNLVQGDFLQGRSFADAVELYRLTTGHDGKEILMHHITEHNAHLGQYRLVYHQIVNKYEDNTETTRLMYTYSSYLDRLEATVEFVEFANDGLPIFQSRTYGVEDVITDDEIDDDETPDELVDEPAYEFEEIEDSESLPTNESVEMVEEVAEESGVAELTSKQPKKPKTAKVKDDELE